MDFPFSSSLLAPSCTPRICSAVGQEEQQRKLPKVLGSQNREPADRHSQLSAGSPPGSCANRDLAARLCGGEGISAAALSNVPPPVRLGINPLASRGCDRGYRIAREEGKGPPGAAD